MTDQELNDEVSRVAFEAAEVATNIAALKERIKDNKSKIKAIPEVQAITAENKGFKEDIKDHQDILDKLSLRLLELQKQKG